MSKQATNFETADCKRGSNDHRSGPVSLGEQHSDTSSITAHTMSGDLKVDAEPIRFMDLPRELRNTIYELALLEPLVERKDIKYGLDDYRLEDSERQLYSKRRHAFSTGVNNVITLAEHPPLLRVSRQVREEADEIYWSKIAWDVELDAKYNWEDDGFRYDEDLSQMRKDLQKWVDKMGMNRLQHLRDLTVAVELCLKPHRCIATPLRVIFIEGEGFKAEMPQQGAHVKPGQVALARHLAWTEWRREFNGWKGEGIVDYFLGNPAFWNTWFWEKARLKEMRKEKYKKR